MPGGAEDVLGVFGGAVLLPVQIGEITLGVDNGEHGLDRRQLVLADPPVEDLFLPRGGVEPPAVVDLFQRDRKRPVILADDQSEGIARSVEMVRFAGPGQEFLAAVFVGNGVTGMKNGLDVGPENPGQSRKIARFQIRDDRLQRVLGRGEVLLMNRCRSARRGVGRMALTEHGKQRHDQPDQHSARSRDEP